MRHLQRFGILGIIVLLAASCQRPPAEGPPHLIEQLTINGRTAKASSKQPLAAGKLYSMVIFGLIHYAPRDDAWLDAQQVYLPNTQRWEPKPILSINDQPAVAGVGDLNRHAYIFYVAGSGQLNGQQNASFTFKDVNDSSLENNSGQLNVQIYEGYLKTLPDKLSDSDTQNSSLQIPVYATGRWQDTHIPLKQGQTFKVLSVTGTIMDDGVALSGGNGKPDFICSQRIPQGCCDPMPDQHRSALIGKIGQHNLLIGNGRELSAPEDGELQLRINDCDDGLENNSGLLTVEIQLN